MLIILALIFTCTFGQISDYQWPDSMKQNEGLDYLKSTFDALILSETHEINYTSISKQNITHTVRQRIKILTELGLDQSAYICIPRVNYQDIKLLDAITIKQDGRTVDLDAADIYNTNINPEVDEENFNNENIDFIRFAIPGVEVGDEIEIIYSLDRPDFYGGDIIPNSHAYSISTTFNFILPSTLDFLCTVNNGFPEPETFDMQYDCKRVVFTIRNVKSILNEYYSIPHLSQPWFSFKVRPVTVFSTPNDTMIWHLFNQSMKMSLSNTPKEKRSRHKKHYNQLFYGLTDSVISKFGKFRILYHYLVDSIEIRDQLSKKETGKSNEFYLYNRFTDRMILYRLIVQFLDQLELDYHLCFARNRYRGPIQVEYPRHKELDEFLFLIYDDNRKPHFLNLDHPITYYELDEIPSHLSGSLCVFVNSENHRHWIDTIRLPNWETDITCMIDDIRLVLDPVHSDTSKMIINTTFSGHFSNILRGMNQMMHQDSLLKKAFLEYSQSENPDLHIDSTVLVDAQREFPFKYRLITRGEFENVIDIINDSLIGVPLINFISHPVLETYTARRLLDYYPEFKFKDSVSVTFVLPEGYDTDVINIEDLDLLDSNNTGSYCMQVRQYQNEIKIMSAYRIWTDRIPVQEINTIGRLNELYDRGRHSSLLIRHFSQ